MKRRAIEVLFGLALALSASTAHALFIIAGNGVETGSWSIPVNFSSAPAADTIEFFIQGDTGAGPFEAPGVQFSSPAGWTGQLINPGYVLAAGPGSTFWASTWFFDGNIADSVAVDVFFYGVGILLSSAQVRFADGQLSGQGLVTDPTGQAYDRSSVPSVPEPATLALLGLALAGLGFSRRTKA